MLENDFELVEKYVLCGDGCTCKKCMAWLRIKKKLEEPAQQTHSLANTPCDKCEGDYIVGICNVCGHRKGFK